MWKLLLLVSSLLMLVAADERKLPGIFLRKGGFSFGRRRRGGRGRRRRSGLVIVRSRNSFEDTYNNLTAALNGVAPISIFGEIDHSANAASVNLTLDPLRLVVFGNPNLGSPIQQQDLISGIDFPQKFIVYQVPANRRRPPRVFVAYNAPSYLAARFPAIRAAPQLETVGGALMNFASAATGVPVRRIRRKVPRRRSLRRIKRSNGVVTMQSDADFTTTVDRLVAFIEQSPARLAIRVDHSANSNGVLTPPLPPSTLLVFGNPNAGTPLMQKNPTAGIDLPMKILVTEAEPGKVKVTTNSISFLSDRHGLGKLDLTMITNGLNNFVMAAAVTTPPTRE